MNFRCEKASFKRCYNTSTGSIIQNRIIIMKKAQENKLRLLLSEDVTHPLKQAFNDNSATYQATMILHVILTNSHNGDSSKIEGVALNIHLDIIAKSYERAVRAYQLQFLLTINLIAHLETLYSSVTLSLLVKQSAFNTRDSRLPTFKQDPYIARTFKPTLKIYEI